MTTSNGGDPFAWVHLPRGKEMIMTVNGLHGKITCHVDSSIRFQFTRSMPARSTAPVIGAAWMIAMLITVIPSHSAAAHGRHAVDYTDTYALSPNQQCWDYFSEGDCTNFVSQGLWAGGLDMITSGSYQWYMIQGWFGGYSSTNSWRVTYDLIDQLVATSRASLLGNEPIMRRSGSTWRNRAFYGDVLFYDLPGVYPEDGPSRRDHAAMEAQYYAWHEDNSANTNMYGDVVNYHTTNRKHAIWNLMHAHPYSSTGPNVSAVLYRLSYPTDHQQRACP